MKRKEYMKATAYEAPAVEVIEVMVEQGFNYSTSDGAFGDEGIVITPPMS